MFFAKFVIATRIFIFKYLLGDENYIHHFCSEVCFNSIVLVDVCYNIKNKNMKTVSFHYDLIFQKLFAQDTLD